MSSSTNRGAASLPNRNFYSSITSELHEVVDNLTDLAAGESSLPKELLGDVLASEGKLVRPAITLLASKFHPNDGSLSIRMATAVELLHIATLIHDDTVDDAAVRHGKATVSSTWGGKVAVLLGDYLFATSATLVCDTLNIRVIRRFSETIKELSTGELMEIMGSCDWNVSRDQYWRRIYYKTASLFRTAAESGAILSGAPVQVVDAFCSYGYNLGMAFQVIDDLLDFQSTSEEIGKPAGNDLRQGTMTLPAVMLLERYPDNNPVVALFKGLTEGNEKQSQERFYINRAVEMIQNSSILQDIHNVAAGFCKEAQKALESCEENVHRKALMEVAEYVMERHN